ncbi:MAG: endolytic transglycosylase MltG [Parcubacteria group bacterium]|nr:MAG: endolytic transglycosylase MltG [Parcubacteria group bacterium]
MKKIIVLLFIALLAGAIWLSGGVIRGNKLNEQQTVVVASGQGVHEISRDFYSQGIIQNKFIFESWVWFKQAGTHIKSGSYVIPAHVSVRRLVNILLLGPGHRQTSFTFIEGWDRGRAELKDLLQKNGFDYDQFLKWTAHKQDWQEQYDFLAEAPATASLEGYLFPNTHFIDEQTTEKDLIDKMLDDFGRQLDPELRAEIRKQNKTIFEVITLASIVEREVPAKADKKMIADVFIKRLQNGIGLQSDATINFITGKGLVQPTGDDVQVDSPYNTYKFKGLPPGPIGNPGLDSIKAVIYPTDNPYYYFLTTKDGTVIYSKTYEEHLANKKKYLP